MFAFGLFKKTVLASSLAQFADPVFDGGSRSIGFLNAWTAATCYGLQLYFDFSGYSDMAIGAARMFGVRLPINFNSPLKAVNLIDFWRRWHMTMTRFFTDYVYSPLALRWTRESVLRRDPRVQQFLIGVALPTLISFVLIGWWHGAQWTFIVFGFVHGLALTVNQAWRRLRWPAPPRLVGWAITFCIFTVSVVLVRAPNMEQAVAVYQAMAGAQVPGFAALIAELRHAWTLPEGQGKVMLPLLGLLSRLTHAPELLIYLTALMVFCWAMPNTVQVMSHYRPALTDVYRGYTGAINWRPNFCWSIAVAAILTLAILNISHVQPFIYIRF
jgi:D-alanyl-lipoteichoic acid acyltransferase DltB (MBOAT superfamily)